jgi:plastocyanin
MKTGNGYVFSPDSITIHVGDTVKWVDTTDMMHTVTANDHSFNGEIPAKGSWSHIFTTAGTYHYMCANHPGQTGIVIVTA